MHNVFLHKIKVIKVTTGFLVEMQFKFSYLKKKKKKNKGLGKISISHRSLIRSFIKVIFISFGVYAENIGLEMCG